MGRARRRNYVEQVMKNPLVLGPSGAMLTATMKAKAADRQGGGDVVGRDGPLHQARPGADAPRAQPDPEPPLDIEEKLAESEVTPSGPWTSRRYTELKIAPARRLRHACPSAAPACASWSRRGTATGAPSPGGPSPTQIRRSRSSSGRRASAPATAPPSSPPTGWSGCRAALAIQAAGGVMVPVYAANTARAGGVRGRSTATPRWSSSTRPRSSAASSRRGTRTTPWSASCCSTTGSTRRAVLAQAPRAGQEGARRTPRRSADSCTWSRASPSGPRATREDPGAFERMMDAVSLDQPGMMLYTSGTSGNPKGVPLTHRNVAVNGLDWLALQRAAHRRGRGRPALAADEPHLRLRRGLPRQHAGLHHATSSIRTWCWTSSPRCAPACS